MISNPLHMKTDVCTITLRWVVQTTQFSVKLTVTHTRTHTHSHIHTHTHAHTLFTWVTCGVCALNINTFWVHVYRPHACAKGVGHTHTLLITWVCIVCILAIEKPSQIYGLLNWHTPDLITPSKQQIHGSQNVLLFNKAALSGDIIPAHGAAKI